MIPGSLIPVSEGRKVEDRLARVQWVVPPCPLRSPRAARLCRLLLVATSVTRHLIGYEYFSPNFG